MNKLFCNKGLSRFVLLIAFVFTSSTFANSATFTVTKTADTNDGVCNADCSLREAIASANTALTDDVIAFEQSVFNTARTISLNSSQLSIANSGSLIINGTGPNSLTISGNNQSRVFSISNGSSMIISNLRISEGSSQNGGGIHNEGTLTLNNLLVRNNTSGSNNGGGVYNNGASASLTINNSIIRNNTGNGAGVFNFNGTVSVNNSIVSFNIGFNGAGIFNYEGTLSLADSTINNNSAGSELGGGVGGGIYNTKGKVTLTRSTLSNNGATIGGGGINNTDNGTVSFVNSTLNQNFISNGVAGGGISNNAGGSMSLNNSVIRNNSACSGCAGGGISNNGNGSVLNLTNVTVNNNSAGIGGGALANSGNAIANIKGTVISFNTAGGGGAISTGDGAVNLTNTTVSNNTSNGSFGGGGGIYIGGGELNLINATIVNNKSTGSAGGGGIRNGGGSASGTINSRNSIIADNSATISTAQDIFGTLNSQGFNLIENTNSATIIGETNSNIIGQDPLLLPLGNYGSMTETVALQPTSPAIDAADPNNFPETDQRGITRPQDGDLNGTALPDIGVYEREVTAFTVTKPTDTNDGNCDSDCSLREALAAINSATTLDNAVLFDISMFSVAQTITLMNGELKINQNKGTVFIKGMGVELLTISGNNANRVLSIGSNVTATLSGVRIINGNINDVGGGVFNYGTLIINDSTISNNKATAGGGIYNYSDRSILITNNSIITGNTATRSSEVGGGGIYNGGLVIINSSSITENSSASSGGGVGNNGALNVNNSKINGNISNQGGGGGIHNYGSTTLNNSSVNNNSTNSNSGGGISNNYNFLTIINSTIAQNSAAGNGGGIYNSGTVKLMYATVSGNKSGSLGSGGGGISNQDFGSLSLTNSTITGNFSAIDGGGIYNSSFFTTTLINSTVAKNVATKQGGGIANFGAANALNTIISDNMADNSAQSDFFGILTSQGYNLIENTNRTTITGVTTGNILGQDPQLLPLGNYGGTTQTHALRLTSPAIDKGSSVTGITTDQRGLSRPFDFPSIPNAQGGNGTDIGAYERQIFDIKGNVPFDFDGDDKSDFSIYRPALGEWWYYRSSDGNNRAFQFGSEKDKLVPADYTGDGKTDIAFYRSEKGEWFILRSEDGSYYSFPFGVAEDIPVPADYDGDGNTDVAIYRPSNFTWYVLTSTGGIIIWGFGAVGELPVPADYNGDGRVDFAVYKPSTNTWRIRMPNSELVFSTSGGDSTEMPVPADYTGDGKADIAYYNGNGRWTVVRSENNTNFTVNFGTAGDIPAPGDYDGDGKTDLAIYRPSTATWWYSASASGGQHRATQFGISTDKPVPSAFVR